MNELDYTPEDNEMIFTKQDIQNALLSLTSNEALDIFDMAETLTRRLSNISADSALILLAEIGVQPNKKKKLREMLKDG
jgi:hypothetical protein